MGVVVVDDGQPPIDPNPNCDLLKEYCLFRLSKKVSGFLRWVQKTTTQKQKLMQLLELLIS